MKKLVINTICGLLLSIQANGQEIGFELSNDSEVCVTIGRAGQCIEWADINTKAYLNPSYADAETNITCSLTDDSQFKMHISLEQAVKGTGSLYVKHFVGTFKPLYGPRLNSYEYTTLVSVNDILTRVHTGKKYTIHTTNGDIVSLKDIDYTYNEEKFPSGFHGTYQRAAGGGKIQALSCEASAQQEDGLTSTI